MKFSILDILQRQGRWRFISQYVEGIRSSNSWKSTFLCFSDLRI